MEDLKEEVGRLERELREKEKELLALQNESFKESLRSQSLEQQISDLKKNLVFFEQGVKNKEGLDLLLSQLQNEIGQKNVTIDSLKSQLMTYQHKPNFEEKQAESLKKELRKAQEENSQMKIKAMQAEGQMQEFQRKLISDNQQAQSQLSKLEKQLNLSTLENEQKNREILSREKEVA